MSSTSSELIVKLQARNYRIRELEKALCALVQIHKNHYGLDGAWDTELVKAERLLEES